MVKEPAATLKVGTGLAWWRAKHEPPLTQTEVAELLGLRKSTYCLIEQGRLFPTMSTVDELCRILGVPAGALFVPEVLEISLQHGQHKKLD